jgi:hypothetical protein
MKNHGSRLLLADFSSRTEVRVRAFTGVSAPTGRERPTKASEDVSDGQPESLPRVCVPLPVHILLVAASSGSASGLCSTDESVASVPSFPMTGRPILPWAYVPVFMQLERQAVSGCSTWIALGRARTRCHTVRDLPPSRCAEASRERVLSRKRPWLELPPSRTAEAAWDPPLQSFLRLGDARRQGGRRQRTLRSVPLGRHRLVNRSPYVLKLNWRTTCPVKSSR